VAEQIVVNKVDAADAETLDRLRGEFPDAVFVSAHTGEGLDKLRAVVTDRLPRPDAELRVLVPYERGDLVARVHGRGEVLASEHTEHGTLLHARVDPDLAATLMPYIVSPTA
jgi:GTPase